MGKHTNTSSTNKTRRLLALIVGIIMAVALAVTGILCFSITKGKSIENSVGDGDESATVAASAIGGKTIDLSAQILAGKVKAGDVINLPFAATLNARPSGVNAYWKNRQNGYVANSGMYTITLPVGEYKFELWGGQGGNTNSNTTTSHAGGGRPVTTNGYKAYGGMGAYATGVLTITTPTTVYIQVGGMGTSDLDNPTTRGYVGGGYNGGGGVTNDGNGGGGGGATDLRIEANNLNNRVLVAAGGGGASWGSSNPGGAGGGSDKWGTNAGTLAGSGEAGYLTQSIVNNAATSWWGDNNATVGGGGTQTHGGYYIAARNGGTTHASINNELRNTTQIHAGSTYTNGSTSAARIATTATEGSWGQGGQGAGSHWAGGGGGGGWYGGGGGYVHTGGGGSSFALTSATPAASMPASYAFKTNGKYRLTETSLVSGLDARLRGDTGALKNPGGTGFGTTGRKNENWAAARYPTSYNGCGYNDDCGDGYARITVRSFNHNPTTRSAQYNFGKRGVRSGSDVISVTANAIASDPEGGGVYFTNGGANLDEFTESGCKFYLNAACTLDATDETTGYVRCRYINNNNTIEITEVFKYPRKGAYATQDGRLTLYAKVRDTYKSQTERGWAAIPFYVNVDPENVTVKAHDSRNGIELYADDDSTNIYNNFYVGLSSTDDITQTPSENNIYNPNGDNIYTAMLKQPLRLPNASGAAMEPVVLYAKDLFEGLNTTLNAKLGREYDDAIFSLDVSKIMPSDKTRNFRVVEYDNLVANPGLPDSVFYKKDGTRILNAFRQLTFEGVNSDASYLVLPATVYVIENNAAGGNNYEFPYTNAFTIEIVIKVDNTRPRLRTALDNGENPIDPPVVELDALKTETVDLNKLFIDDDNAKIDAASHKIAEVKVAEEEYIQLDKYGNVKSAVNSYIDGEGSTYTAAYYNLFDGTDSNLPSAAVMANALTSGVLHVEGDAYSTGFQRWYISQSMSSGNAFVQYSFSNATLTLTGLRATYPLYKSARSGYKTIISGSTKAAITQDDTEADKAANAGDFYILVRLIDYNDTSDMGIWLPIGIRVKNTAPTDVSTERNQPGASELPTAEGDVGAEFYFTPMGITYNRSFIPLGKYENSEGRLDDTKLRALGSDVDNFYTESADMLYNGVLNELLTAKSTADEVMRVGDEQGRSNELYYTVTEIPIYIPKTYFGTGSNKARLALSDYEGKDAGTAYAGASKFAADYVAIRGYKITLKGWTHNRYLFAPVTLVDSAGDEVNVDIAVKVNNSTPTGLKANEADKSEYYVSEYSYTNSATGVSSSAKYDATGEVPTITYNIPIGSSVIVTPYDILTDVNMTDFGVKYPTVEVNGDGGPKQKNVGFTLNGIRGIYDDGTLTVNSSVVKGGTGVFYGMANEDNAISGGFDYSSAEYMNALKPTLDGITATRNIAAVSMYNTFDAASAVDYDSVGIDGLYFERTDDASHLDGFTFNPYSASSASRNSFSTPTITNGTYVSRSFGSKLVFPSGFFDDEPNSVSYGIDFIILTGVTRTPANNAAEYTMTVRDRTGASATGAASGIKTFKIKVNVVNSTPTLRDDARPITLKTSVSTAGEYTIREIEAEKILVDNENDKVSFHTSGYKVIDSQDRENDGLIGNRRYLGSYVDVSITETTIKVTALNSSQNIEGLYLEFKATDGRDSDKLSVLRLRIEVFNSAPTANVGGTDGFDTQYVTSGSSIHRIDNMWTVSSTTQSDQKMSRYFASGEAAVEAIKQNIGANSTQIKRIINDTDALQGVVLSPRVEAGADMDGGSSIQPDSGELRKYINAPAGTDDYSKYVPFATEVISSTVGTGNYPIAVKISFTDVKGDPIYTDTPGNYASFDVVYFVDTDGNGTKETYYASALRSSDPEFGKASFLNEKHEYFFDDKGRWTVTDWAVEIRPVGAFPLKKYFTIDIKMRDEVKYGGDSAGFSKVSDYEYIKTDDNPDEAAGTVLRDSATNGFAQIAYHLNIRETGIVTYDYYDRFDGLYTVTDIQDPTKSYIPTYDGDSVGSTYPSGQKALYYTESTDSVGSYVNAIEARDYSDNTNIIKRRQSGTSDGTPAGVNSGAEYTGSNSEAELKGAFRYSHTIEVPDTGVTYIPMSYFALNSSVIRSFGTTVSDFGPVYDTNVYVAYNVATPYDRSIFAQFQEAITISDGVNTYRGSGNQSAGILPLSQNPYVQINAYDATNSNNVLDSGSTGYAAYQESLNSAYFNKNIAINTYTNDSTRGYIPIQQLFKDGTGGYVTGGNNPNLNNIVGEEGRILHLLDQQTKLQEHLFGISLQKSTTSGQKLSRYKTSDITVTIDVAWCSLSDDGRTVSAGSQSEDDDDDETADGQTARVSFNLHIGNSKLTLDGSTDNNADTDVRFDKDGNYYYTEARMKNGDNRFEIGLVKKGTTSGSEDGAPNKVIKYVDSDAFDSAQFSIESTYKLGNWSTASSYTRVLELSGQEFKNTNSDSHAQKSMLNYFGQDASKSLDSASIGSITSVFQPNGGIYGTNLGTSGSGREGYSRYFGLSLSEDATKLYITPYAKTIINPDVYNDAKGYAYQSAVKSLYDARGLVPQFDDRGSVVSAYYPLKILVYDDCGDGWAEASYVALEVRVYVENSAPTFTKTLLDDYNPDNPDDPSKHPGDKVINVSLAVDDTYQFNLRDVIQDADLLKDDYGNWAWKGYYLDTVNANAQSSGPNQYEWMLKADSGDYLASPFAMEGYLNSGNTQLIDGRAKFSDYNAPKSSQSDIIMYMPYVTSGGNNTLTADSIPLDNSVSIRVNRRTTYTVANTTYTKEAFVFTVNFGDSAGALTGTLTINIKINNKVPQMLSGMTNAVRMRVGDSFTVFTTPYDYMFDGSASSEASNTKLQYYPNRQAPNTNLPLGDGQFGRDGFRNLTFENIRSETGIYRLHDYDYDKDGMPSVPVQQTAPKNSFTGGTHLGYTAIATDDTPWSLRITGISDNVTNYLSFIPSDEVLFEKDGSDSRPIDYTLTANGKVCQDLPVTFTVSDGDEGGIFQYTIYVTVESTVPSAVNKANESSYPLNYGLDYDDDKNSADAGFYKLYMTTWSEATSGENSESSFNLGGASNVKAFSELTINVASNKNEQNEKLSGGIAYDRDITDHTKLALYVPIDEDGKEGSVFTINNEPMVRTAVSETTVTYMGNHFEIVADSEYTSFKIKCLSYDPENDWAELKFYVADMSDNLFSRSRPITINICTLYSAMRNRHDASNTQYTGGQYVISDSGIDTVTVKPYQTFINEELSTPSVYRFLGYSGEMNSEQNSISSPRIVDNDVLAGEKVALNYDLRIYAFIYRSGSDYKALDVGDVSDLMAINPSNGYFRLKTPDDLQGAMKYLIGGRRANGSAWSGEINQNILSYTQRYFSFSIGADGVSLNFRPVTATFDTKILFYVELTKYISRDITPSSDMPKSAGTLFYVNVDDSAPIANTNTEVLEFEGRVGESHTFKIFDMDDPYESLFTDSDTDDVVFVNGFSRTSTNVDSDYEAALGGNNIDWRSASGGRSRAISIVSDNTEHTLTVKILRRIDVSDGKGGYLSKVPLNVVIKGTDRSGSASGKSTSITLKVTICNSDPFIDLDALREYRFNDADTATVDMTSRFSVDGMGYEIQADDDDPNKFIVNTYVANDLHGYRAMDPDNTIGSTAPNGNLVIDTGAWIGDPDFTTVRADTESYRLVDGPLALREYYVVDKAIPVYAWTDGHATEEKIATITPAFTGGNLFYFTGFTIAAQSYSRGATGVVYMRLIDRSGDGSTLDNGITLEIHVTILNTAPTIVAGKENLSFDFIGSKSKEGKSQKLSIKDLVTDINPSDTPDKAGKTETYLRIINIYGETPEQLLSTVNMDNSDLIASFTFTDSGDNYNQTCVISPIIGVFGTQTVFLVIADGDTSLDPTAASVKLAITITVAYPFDELPQFNEVATLRGMTTKITTEVLVPEIPNQANADPDDSVSESAYGVNASADGEVEMFNPGAGYAVTKIYAPNSYVDYVNIDQDRDGIWQFRALQIPPEGTKIFLNVEFKLRSEMDNANAEIFPGTFLVSIGENPKPKLIPAFEQGYTFFSSGNGYVLNSEGTVYLTPNDLFTDNDGDIMKFVSAKTKSPSLVSVQILSEEALSLTFNASGETMLTIFVADTTEESIGYTFAIKNIDLPAPSFFMTIKISFESNLMIWLLAIAGLVLAILILIIVIILLKRRKRKREELEELLISEMELEEQMMRIAASSANPYQDLGMIPPMGNIPDPGMMIGAGGINPDPNMLNLNPGQDPSAGAGAPGGYNQPYYGGNGELPPDYNP